VATTADTPASTNTSPVLPIPLKNVVFSVGMDECDTAAAIFNCAKEKDPNVALDMISAFEMNSSAVLFVYHISKRLR